MVINQKKNGGRKGKHLRGERAFNASLKKWGGDNGGALKKGYEKRGSRWRRYTWREKSTE